MKGEEFPGKLIVRCVGVMFICSAIVWVILIIADVKAQGVLALGRTENFWDRPLLCLFFLVLGYWLVFERRDRDP